MRRRLLIVLAGLIVAAGVAVAVFVVVRERQIGDVRGSASVEYTTTAAKPVGPVQGVQWSMYGYDAARTRSVDLPLRPPFHRLWYYPTHSLVEFPPAIGYGRLYFAGGDGTLFALNERTGRKAWHYDSGRCVAASPAVGAYGSLFMSFLNKPPCNQPAGTPGLDGVVMRFAVGFGHVIWKTTIGPSESSPLLLDGRVYVGDWNGDVWALDGSHGKVLWKARVGGAVKGGLAYANGRLYAGSYDGHVYCFSLAGKLLWKAAAQGTLLHAGRFYATPTVAHGRVYVGSTDGKLYSFGATTGKLRWSHSTGGYVYSSAAVWHDRVLVGSYSHRFFAFDAATGATRWVYDAPAPISGSPTVVGTVVYVSTLRHWTYALDVRTGKLLWSYFDGKYSPVVAVPGRLFLVGYQRVYAMVPG